MTPLFRCAALALLLPAFHAFAGEPAYMRVGGSGSVRVLVTAAVKFRPPAAQAATHPAIWLVGVTHIGDASYYASLQKLLNAQACVFFEALRSSSALSQHDYDLSIRTALGLQHFADRCSRHRRAHGAWPLTPEALRSLLPEGSTPADREALLADAYGTPWRMRVDCSGALHLSAGAGGLAITLAPDGSRRDAAANALSDVQQVLARALGLAWQLTELNYNYPSFTNADTSMADLLASLQQSLAESEKKSGDLGLDAVVVLAVLSGNGAAWISTALNLFEGACRNAAVRETVRYALLLACANFDALSAQLDSALPGFNRALLRERNRAALLMLKARLCEFGPADSVALLYGAAHAGGLHRRLLKMGYEPVETRFYPAFEADTAAIPFFNRLDRALRDALRVPEGQ